MHVPEEMRLAAKKGAALLDDEHPGWAEKLDLISLNLRYRNTCVLGQLYGDYDDAVEDLDIRGCDEGELGFNLYVRRPWDWAKLDIAWRHEIAERS